MNRAKWIRQKAASSFQSLLLVASLAAVLGTIGWLLGGSSLALMVVGAVIMLYFLNPMVSPSLAMRMHRGRRMAYDEAPRLYTLSQSLAERAELPRVPALFYLPGNVMNAFTAGTSQNAAIAVSEGLLRRLDIRELAAVMAHEIGHVRNNDIRIMGFADTASRMTRMLSLFGQFLLLLNLPLILFGESPISWAGILLLIFAPSLSVLLQLALSRTREYHADLGAAELTGDPEALASALMKMESFRRNPLFRILWPAYSREPEISLMRTHPPTAERIRRLRAIEEIPLNPESVGRITRSYRRPDTGRLRPRYPAGYPRRVGGIGYRPFRPGLGIRELALRLGRPDALSSARVY